MLLRIVLLVSLLVLNPLSAQAADDPIWDGAAIGALAGFTFSAYTLPGALLCPGEARSHAGSWGCIVAGTGIGFAIGAAIDRARSQSSSWQPPRKARHFHIAPTLHPQLKAIWLRVAF